MDENVKNEFKEGDSENMHDEDDYSCKVEEDVIHQELILNENPVILLWFLVAFTFWFSCKGVLIHQLKIGQCSAATCAAADPSLTWCLILLLGGRQDSLSKGRDHELVFEVLNVSEDTSNHIPVDEARHKELAVSNTLWVEI